LDHFDYKQGELYCEDVAIAELAATYGTPLFVYSRATLERHWHAFDNALAGHDHLVCYAVKANSNLALLNLLARLGSGFDIVSGGEMQRVLEAGGDAARIVFSSTASTKSPGAWASARGFRFASTRTWTPRPTPIFQPGSRTTSSAWLLPTRRRFT
jgi:diaminopimelate decarboxylase